MKIFTLVLVNAIRSKNYKQMSFYSLHTSHHIPLYPNTEMKEKKTFRLVIPISFFLVVIDFNSFVFHFDVRKCFGKIGALKTNCCIKRKKWFPYICQNKKVREKKRVKGCE